MNDALLVFLTAMTPIGELRAAIPLGVIANDLNWLLVLVIAIAGNLVPVPFIIIGLRLVGERLEKRDDIIGSILRWRTARVERWRQPVERYGFWAVMMIVAIPLPLTGAWSGSLAVYVFRVPLRTGLTAIAAGVVVAGVVVMALTQAGIGLIKLTG